MGDVGGTFAELGAQRFPRLQLGAVGFDLAAHVLLASAARFDLLQRSGEQAAGQRAVADEAHAVLLHRGDHLELDRSRREVVHGLLGGEAQEMPVARKLVGSSDVPTGEVRRADVQDLALALELLHGFPDLVPPGVPVDVMHLIQVDGVGAHAPQRLLALPDDRQLRQSGFVGPVAHGAVDLGRQHDLVATPASLVEPLADDVLTGAHTQMTPVHVGGIEEVDAVRDG